MRDNSWQFGIGTSSPTTKLEVQGTASASYLLTGNTIQVGGYASVAYSRFGTSATGHSNYISASNDVLINGDLEIDGSASFAGVASVSGNLYSFGNIGIGVIPNDARFEILDSTTGVGTSDGIASISATALTAGNFFQGLVPVSSSFTGSIFKIRDTTGRILFRVTSGGELDARQAVFSHGSTTNCTAVDTPTGGCIDYAEDMPTSDDTLLAGELVSINVEDETDFLVVRSNTVYDKNLIGIVSTKPAILIGNSVRQGDFAQQREKGKVPIALSGRVPVKISYENGDIKKGDYLTSSSAPGMAMKATHAGRVVGIALASAQQSRGDVSVMLFINPHYAGYELDVNGQLASFGSPNLLDTPQTSALDVVIGYLKDAVLSVKAIIADSIETKFLKVREGIIMYDELTDEPYCVTISGGQLKQTSGSCDAEATVAPDPVPQETPIIEETPMP